LALLSAAAPAQLTVAIAAQDRAVLTEAEGVGPKLAQRIVNELKDKVAGIELRASGAPPQGATNEAVSALVNLGYARSDAYGAVATAMRRLGAEASLDALIRSGLKELAR
jgi:Holliday junction DNA helicase RuvA